MNLVRQFQQDPLGFVAETMHTYGDLSLVQFGLQRLWFVNHPDLIREVLVNTGKTYRKVPKFVKQLAEVDGQGLVTSSGDLWRRQRRLVQPAFSTRRLDGYATAIVQITQKMLESWKSDETRNLADDMTYLTLRIIARTLFDVQLESEVVPLGKAVHAISEIFTREAGQIIPVPNWLPIPSKIRKRKAVAFLHRRIEEIIARRRAEGVDHGDLLSILLSAVDDEGDGNGMNDRQIRDEAVTLFNAGHDSSAAALAWLWYLVGKYPEVAQRLHAEGAQLLAGRTPTYADVAQLPYTEAVVKETMRLYPPTWAAFPREPLTEVTLGGQNLRPGEWVYIAPWGTQRDPRFFPNPLKFDPGRFLPDRIGEIPQYGYIPFGGGPHICIGLNFAMMEMVLIVQTILQQFEVQMSEGAPEAIPEPLIAIRPRGGVRLTIKRRSRNR
jgi:cytochrome P450